MSEDSLPIKAYRKEIIRSLKENNVIVVTGETGSGKTTQIPPSLYRAGFADSGKIGVVQPRQVAAISTAKYVAELLGVNLGSEVGYRVRFENETWHGTKIQFMTDGMLLREAQYDPSLSAYSVIMVDEAHERSLNIDFTLGLLKEILMHRQDLKVIVASATIEPEKFADYFAEYTGEYIPIIKIPAKNYPVEIRYAPKNIEFEEKDTVKLIEAIAAEVIEIYSKTSIENDILIFLTGKAEIDEVVEHLGEAVDSEKAIILPAYGEMMPEEQQRIFLQYPGKRKIVVATNIAETSITIDGISYVIDSGYVKQAEYDPRTGIRTLTNVKHSKAGCNQRAGRAGRTKPGVCIRLYTKEDFEERQSFSEPEIKRAELSSIILNMRTLGIKRIGEFSFLDPMPQESLDSALNTLKILGALDENGRVTSVGITMSYLPMVPYMSKMLVSAIEFGCVKEVATIAASLTWRMPFVRPRGQESEADNAHSKFRDPESDFHTILKMWDSYLENELSRDWCIKNFLNWRMLEKIVKTRSQIFDLLRQESIPEYQGAPKEEILKAVASGLVHNFCERNDLYSYRKADADKIFIHPSSSLFGNPGDFIVCGDITTTKKTYARYCAAIKPEWILINFPGRIRKYYGWDPKSGYSEFFRIEDFDLGGNIKTVAPPASADTALCGEESPDTPQMA